MNKQEAIERIKQETYYHCGEKECYKDGCKKYVESDIAIDIINQINEPQKVVIPKFVAEWIEETKRVYNLYGAMGRIKNDLAPSEILKWFGTNPTLTGEILARAWLDGYEIEQEKLYTVEIPNPNKKGKKKVMLLRDIDGSIIIGKRKESVGKNNHLTESEIKQDFEWAWQFAKEVE